MWIGRKVALEDASCAIEGVLLPQKMLLEQQQALSVLALAQQRSEAMLAEAGRQVERLLTEAQQQAERQAGARCEEVEQAFWQRSEALFSEWHDERTAQQNQILNQAQALINAAFEQLFGGLTEQQKLTGLLAQLQQAGGRATEVTLYHASRHEAVLAEWLDAHPQLGWSRCIDDAMAAETLLLQTAQGEFSISWNSLRQHLLRLAD